MAAFRSSRVAVYGAGILSMLWLAIGVVHAEEPVQKRPMTFDDVLNMRSIEGATVSPDGRTLAYLLREPSWRKNASGSDIWTVSIDEGLPSTRRLTDTPDAAESDLMWLNEGRGLVYLSDGGGAEKRKERQLWLLDPATAQTSRLTDIAGGLSDVAFSPDGRWLGFTAGRDNDRGVWLLPVGSIANAAATRVIRYGRPVGKWKFTPDSRNILFVAPDAIDDANQQRIALGFTARRRFEPKARNSLWSFDLAAKTAATLVSSPAYSIDDFVLSDDGRWIGFRGGFVDRYQRGGNEGDLYSDLHLLNRASGQIERLTENANIGERQLGFTPDSRQLVFVAPDEFQTLRNNRLYVRNVAGGPLRKLGDGIDGNVSIDFWSPDGATIYFNEGKGTTDQLYALALKDGRVTQLTDVKGVVRASRETGRSATLLRYSDPKTPADIYTAPLATVGDQSTWRQLTQSNPQIGDLALGATEVVRWSAPDGQMIEGILVKPLGYREGQRYPLVVMIHGGPAAASQLGFTANYVNYPHVYAAAGYAVLLPNYRGSANYGEKFKLEIVGDYFGKSYLDIISGVDSLVARGLADETRLGTMGWSSGGTWSNWILTHTDRFKAVSSGAGASNWVSFYAQNDLPATREFYHRGTPYDNFDHYWETSTMKHIQNAKTPTLIHIVDGDPRVPRPQSEELYMGLHRQGVPTEMLVYPGDGHQIGDPRNQMVKMVSEFGWMEHWINGKAKPFDWTDLVAVHGGTAPALNDAAPGQPDGSASAK